ncbi:YwdI family protein [Oceanobacillus sp. SE10311]|uniref:YwdI family protein n=2 Tax=unclassified Oceanobacillus TaxID=2630292 RepID=UPI00300E35A9
MSMENRTVLTKMMKELNTAIAKEQDGQDFLQHINNIKLLSELFLEEAGEPVREVQASQSQNTFSEQEIKAMLGEKKSTVIENQNAPATIDHDGANGDSIFDF